MTPDSNGDGRGELIVGSPRADRLGRGDNGSAYFLWGFGSGNLAYPSAGATTVNAPLAPLAPQQIVRTGPIAFSISPALPPGITLDPRTGVITGVPTAIQEQPTTYRLTMTDLAGSISVPVTLRVAPAPGRCANPHDGTPKPDTIVGTGGGDRIATADGGDEVQGLAGDDCISGEGGLDTLSGGDGDDELRGGKDNDTIDAGTGADRAFGDSGQDTITGGGDRDVVYGGSGFDEISGGEGGDSLYGQADSDSLSGGAGNDRLSGGGEADQLSGGAGDDVLIGGGGNDIIFDSRGHNRVDAGSGSDAISVRNGARDVVRCGKGKDHVVADRGDRLSGCEHVRRGGRARHHRRR
jgi:hypothetical protein